MPVTQLDKSVALVVVDLQKGIIAAAAAVSDQVISRTALLAREFRKRGLPVVLVNVTGMAPGRAESKMSMSGFTPDWTELAPGLEQQPSDHTVSKQSWGAFIGTDLHEYLKSRGVTQIVITGISTSAGVESTARSAFDYGYNVVFSIDAMADRSPEAHKNSVEKVFPRLGETDTTDNILKLFAQPHP